MKLDTPSTNNNNINLCQITRCVSNYTVIKTSWWNNYSLGFNNRWQVFL